MPHGHNGMPLGMTGETGRKRDLYTECQISLALIIIKKIGRNMEYEKMDFYAFSLYIIWNIDSLQQR